MKTLLEFITLTKGVEYLIAIAFLIGFIAFWFLLHYRGRGRGFAARILPAGILVLGLGVLVYSCISSQAVKTTAPPSTEAPLLSSAVLVDMYGPASFGHELHQQVVQDCTLCHHHSGSSFPPCRQCHGEPFNPEDLSKPGLAHVYHLRCISCHKENQIGPTDCTGCHAKAAIPPLSTAHPLTGMGKCLDCHGPEGIAGVTKIPVDHAGATNSVCQLCHQPSVAAEALAKHKLPHEIAGREDCLLCHGEGIGGAAKVPTDHAGRTNDTCTLCHKSEKGG